MRCFRNQEQAGNEMTVIGIHQPQYLPWLGFVERVYNCDVFVLLDNVPYSKNYFYNRNRIKTANGWIWLTVPVITKNRFGQLIKDVEIKNSVDWRSDHWKSIFFAYKKSKYFECFASSLEEIYKREWQYLYEICEIMIEFIMKSFGIKTPIYRASELNVHGKKEDLLLNICKKLNVNKYLSGIDGKNYLNLENWKNQQIKVLFQNYKHPKYPQMFNNGFIPQMSSVDLLFNCGPESLNILKDERGEKIGLTLG